MYDSYYVKARPLHFHFHPPPSLSIGAAWSRAPPVRRWAPGDKIRARVRFRHFQNVIVEIGLLDTCFPQMELQHPPSCYVDLRDQVDSSAATCLNADEAGATLAELLAGTGSLLQSADDEQLILHIPFTRPTRLHSLRLSAPLDGTRCAAMVCGVMHGCACVSVSASAPASVSVDVCVYVCTRRGRDMLVDG